MIGGVPTSSCGALEKSKVGLNHPLACVAELLDLVSTKYNRPLSYIKVWQSQVSFQATTSSLTPQWFTTALDSSKRDLK
jgi:hypothetical protein